MNDYPTRETILAELVYDAATGQFGRKRRTAGVRRSGTVKNGYWFDSIGGRQYPRSVLVWIVEHGSAPAGRLRHTAGTLCTRIDTLLPITSKAWDDARDTPAVARHRAWCKRNGVKPIGDPMTARLLDPE